LKELKLDTYSLSMVSIWQWKGSEARR